jgi:hypothetical protein
MGRRVATAGQPPIRRNTRYAVGDQHWGVDVVVSRAPHSRTITTVARRQTGTPVRPVRGSELVAMVDPGAEVTKVSIAEQPRGSPRDQPSRSSHAGHHSVESQLPPPTTNRGYARGICEGIAVRAGELSLCVGRICVVSAGESYALALLAIGALGESVFTVREDQTREVMPQQRQTNNPRPLT